MNLSPIFFCVYVVGCLSLGCFTLKKIFVATCNLFCRDFRSLDMVIIFKLSKLLCCHIAVTKLSGVRTLFWRFTTKLVNIAPQFRRYGWFELVFSTGIQIQGIWIGEVANVYLCLWSRIWRTILFFFWVLSLDVMLFRNSQFTSKPYFSCLLWTSVFLSIKYMFILKYLPINCFLAFSLSIVAVWPLLTV